MGISELSDELLIKILSFLPTKDAVSTSILSKQWEFLWMWLPKLEYTSRYYLESTCERLKCFLDRNLPLHRAPVIESFHLEFGAKQFKPEDIKLWVLTAVSRNVRELEISQIYSLSLPNNIFPSSLYTCKTLVTLKLNGDILMDVPRMVCLPCLITLRLVRVTYLNEDSLQRLLSNCSVLKDLSVERGLFDNWRKFIAIVPSLKRLNFRTAHDLDEIVIKTPSLKYLDFTYYSSMIHHCLIEI
ncbi:FBD-associated F-box protein At4g10400 [Eutrema salsugineum]|uniref:FBD-associated F-box protein At4g10400 n=1 Tax=Eutrema salsugineum TaxID=72664 RepID=UPI000CED728F|nr:FBD-associated F-box protein At4g10400 [Eutrema salsugineum]